MQAFVETFDMDGEGFAPFAEFMWCFAAVLGAPCSKVLFGSWSQVLDDEAVAADNCHETVCLMVGVKFVASILSLCGWCFHIRFAKAVWCGVSRIPCWREILAWKIAGTHGCSASALLWLF